MRENKLTIETDYGRACSSIKNMVLCNNIPEVDESIYENFTRELKEEDTIYQWFITDCDKDDVEYLTSHFDCFIFTYSELLDCYILCVDHFGTNWNYVTVYTDLESLKRERRLR